KAERMLVWDRIEAAYRADQPISGRVVDRVKGGLSVDVGGIKAFLPGSLIDTKPIKNLDSLRGHEYRFKIVSFDKKRNNVVLSRRAIVEFDPAAERVSLGYKQKSPDPWSDVVIRYPLGTKVHGRVVSLTDYGAFVELEEGVEGLIHVSEMSWTKKVRNPSKLLSIGTEVDA